MCGIVGCKRESTDSVMCWDLKEGTKPVVLALCSKCLAGWYASDERKKGMSPHAALSLRFWATTWSTKYTPEPEEKS